MEVRSALPWAVLLGGVVGLAAAGVGTRPVSAPVVELANVPVFAPKLEAPAGLWDIPMVRNASVERFVDLFTGRQSDRMALYLKRSGRYEGMIRAKLRERGMPEDLVYLSMIESGFNPNARSRAQAVGLWQFIAGTGTRYGLRVDSYVDERRDPEKSTDAALRYLTDLYEEFGSWYLAAAAYNTGEGRVRRVMREVTGSAKGEEEDFWRIRRRLPAETREYVPLMLAAALVGKEPHKYGLGHVERWLPLETDLVSVPGGTRLSLVADAVGASEKELKALNPQLVRGMTPPGSKSFKVRIPEGRSERFAANIDAVRTQARATQKARLAKIQAEHKLAKAKASKAKARRSGSKLASSKRHRVRQGESLWTIARRNGTSVVALQRANGLGRKSRIRPGQRLTIPG